MTLFEEFFQDMARTMGAVMTAFLCTVVVLCTVIVTGLIIWAMIAEPATVALFGGLAAAFIIFYRVARRYQ